MRPIAVLANGCPSILNKEESHEPVVMVHGGDLCPTCGIGKVLPFSYPVDKGLIEALHRTEAQETGFQCDNPDCAAKWKNGSRSLASKYKIESRDPKKEAAKAKAETKGGMKKMKSTDMPRRQSPR